MILITGSAGFIGFHLAKKLLDLKFKVIGIDNLNNYYDTKLKRDRNSILRKYKQYNFHKIDLIDKKKLENIFKKYKIKIVINLAAQAGVRNSITNPTKYFDYNILGFFNIIDLSNKYKIKHFLYASTSSVYGLNNTFPLNENLNTNSPLSFYAASKICNESMAFAYSNIFNLHCTGLRFFTVYGPYGRPDMALFKFVDNIQKNKTIELFNYGNHIRDFTYIDDIIESIFRLMFIKPKTKIPFEIFNIGSNSPHPLSRFLKIIEKELNKKAKIKKIKIQKGDIHKTHADTKKLFRRINYKPKTNIYNGINKFIIWYKNYYASNK
tara:strand:- start:658 stop:1626 length:969 start_codon:yes stop_codon:yes gene_type:complete